MLHLLSTPILTFIELSHVHAAVVHLQSCLQRRQELMQEGRVLEQGRRLGLDRLRQLPRRGGRRGGHGGGGGT